MKAGKWFHSNRTPEVAAVTDKKDGAKVGQKKTLVIGLDAVRLDLVLKLLGEGKLPNLKKLIDSGTFIRGRNEEPTVSSTNWISIVSSVSAKNHKADSRNNEESFNRAKRNGTFPPLFYDQLIRKRPELRSAVFSAWTAYFDHCVEGMCDLGYTPTIERENQPNWPKLYDDDVTDKARQFLSGESEMDPDVFFVLLEEGDEVGEIEGFGTDIEPYVEACINYDKRVGQLVETIESRDGFQDEEWMVMVATDHGGYMVPEDQVEKIGGKGSHLETTPVTHTVWAIHSTLGSSRLRVKTSLERSDLLSKDTSYEDIYSEQNCARVKSCCLDFIIPVLGHMAKKEEVQRLKVMDEFPYVEGKSPLADQEGPKGESE